MPYEPKSKSFASLRPLLDRGEYDEAIKQFESTGDANGISAEYVPLIIDIYWGTKDIDAVVRLAHAAMAYCQRHADASADEALQKKLHLRAKSTAYNLGSFTWPGWNEPGVALTPEHVRAGYDAARQNLELAQALDRPPSAMSNAWWLLGAHHMTAGELDGAIDAFTRSVSFAQEAGKADGAAMARGYAAITRMLTGNPGADASFERTCSELEAMNEEDSAFFAQQFRDVRQYLQKQQQTSVR